MKDETKLGEVVIYKDKEGPELRLSLHEDTLWMSQAQIAELFGTQRPAISKHLKNIYQAQELAEKAVSSILEHTAQDGKKYQVQYYNLDAILAVGYRVNSRRATQFRIWATQRLRDYLLKGYVINEKRLREAHETRLKELQQAHLFIRQAVEAKRLSGYEKELASIINDYTQTWVLLNRYDEGDLKVAGNTKKAIKNLDYTRAKQAVEHFKTRLIQSDEASGNFGQEMGSRLRDILKGVSQRKIALESKAATIFYEIIKNRPFVDGNKRIASLLFVVFLIENHTLYDKRGERKFNDNGLVTLALLIEETKPGDKQTVIQLISNLVGKK